MKQKNRKKEAHNLKIIGSVLIFAVGIGLGIASTIIYADMLASKSNETADEITEHLITDKIAIVNLDNGTMVKEEKINYAAKLLVDLNENFLFTGLEDARTGYAQGIYAGYLVIPATFSESVVSLNDTPVRAEITYAINDNLREDIKEQVIYDVINLVSKLNDDVSYMYLHSVMDEFHDAQDEADIVMDNDIEEKNAINAIEANDLVALIPVTEITEVEYNIEPVDISEYISTNVELTAEVGMKYNEYLQASEVDHQKINEEALLLMTEMGNMDTIIGSIDLVHDAEGNSVYQTGQEELDVLFTEHNEVLTAKQEELQSHVLTTYGEVQQYLYEYQRAKEAYQKENEQKYLNTLIALEELFEKYQGSYAVITQEELTELENEIATQNAQIEALQTTLSELQTVTVNVASETEYDGTDGETDGEDASDEETYTESTIQVFSMDEIPEIPSVSMPETEQIELSALQQEMQVVLADNYYIFEGYLLDENGVVKKDEEGNSIPLTSLLAKYNVNLNDEQIKKKVLEEQVGEIELMDISAVTQIVNEKILTPIQEKVTQITTAIMDQYAIEKEQLGAFNESVMEYDPLKYIDHEEIQEITKSMYDNGSAMTKAVYETDAQQMEYVASVYEATRNDLTNMQESIVKAKEDSDLAVAEGLLELQQIKNTNSDENQRIMYDFSEKLPYTRLGSLEYTQAYEFMTNPVGTVEAEEGSNENLHKEDSVTLESESVDVKEDRKKDYQIIGMILLGMICVIIVGTTIKYHFHKKEDEIFEF